MPHARPPLAPPWLAIWNELADRAPRDISYRTRDGIEQVEAAKRKLSVTICCRDDDHITKAIADSKKESPVACDSKMLSYCRFGDLPKSIPCYDLGEDVPHEA
jgi:hypothetical protein